ncbi:unnamed protein product [Rotaria magnacalcarata]|uniref:TIR domain-containing protein n=10 Tax=Rotaria magnacalcarata TaxID=392030 RepID=A0A816YGF6_9BILA|nr:unnamed protein product [Rotaria magnacalcarata]CAF3763286.1 unnamed protein product [Rotaria magnacalcarata]
MDDTDIERLYFTTPLLTPHLSDSNASDYFDLDCSYSSRDHQQRMANIAKDLQEVADLCLQLDDNNESESDVQDQQPTEAADANEITSNIQTTTINTIDNSLHPQPSTEHDGDSFTIVQENNPCEESFSSVMSDTELIPIEEPFKRPVLNYSRSLCLAYTDAKDETSINKETLTTTSDISLEFTEIVTKDKNDIGHILISYNHSTAIICSKIAKRLKNLNYNVWIDRDNISGDIFTSMASAVENCFVILMAVNEPYYQSRYCRLEAEYSVERNKASIPMLMQASYKSRGWLGIINGSKLQIDFSTISFDEAFNLLVREVEAVRLSLGADENFQNVATPINNQLRTTMDNSWFHSQNVQDWSTNDVIEWLNREKLDVFENALRNFTGKTLWQLYKIKLNSPTDYYRMIESLLFPTIPLRLFHNLTFDSALESIFSSIPQAMRR